MAGVDYQIVHSLPGRIRMRLPRIKSDDVFAERLQSYLYGLSGITSIRLSKDCASLTLKFDDAFFSPEDTFAELDENDILLCDSPLGTNDRQLQRNEIYRLANVLEAPPKLQLFLGALSFLASAFSLPVAITRGLLILSSIPIFGRGIRTAIEERRPPVEFLDGPAVVLLAYEGAFLPAAFMSTLIAFGEFIRDVAASRSEAMIDELLSLSRSSAWLIRNEQRIKVTVDKVRVGDEVVVYTGEKVPVTGTIIEGSATVIRSDTAADSMPVEVQTGDNIAAESILLEGKIYVRCTTQRMQLVMDRIMERERRRLLYRTHYQRMALKQGYRIVAPIMFFAALAFLLSRNINQALSIVCFDLVTGIRIALPTAILSYMYGAGRTGVLIKTGVALETLSEIDVFIFARTGVITSGESEVVEVVPLNTATEEKAREQASMQVMRLAAAVESRYHHPAARAIYRYAKRNKIGIVERKDSQLFPGMGVAAEVDGQRIIVGSRRLMKSQSISVDGAKDDDRRIRARGDSVAYVSSNNEVIGLIAYKDRIRPEAHDVLAELRELGMKDIVLTSGEVAESVEATGKEIGVDRIFAQLTPEEKSDLVRDFQLRGQKVAVVGDDVSDALAMAQGDLSIAFNESTDVAQYRADIIITDDDLTHLPRALTMAREARAFLKQNLLLVTIPNWLGLLLSLTNVIGPAKATVLNNGSVILAALNGLRPVFAYGSSLKDRSDDVDVADDKTSHWPTS